MKLANKTTHFLKKQVTKMVVRENQQRNEQKGQQAFHKEISKRDDRYFRMK